MRMAVSSLLVSFRVGAQRLGSPAAPGGWFLPSKNYAQTGYPFPAHAAKAGARIFLASSNRWTGARSRGPFAGARLAFASEVNGGPRASDDLPEGSEAG
jgi:hypothetical protein